MSTHSLPRHPTRSLLPPLGVLEEDGFDRHACLKGTGVTLSELDNPQARMTLQQELTFYRNALELSEDPLIGLRLGEPFIPERYGLFGYALLSASTFRDALSIAVNFGQLTFSFFTFDFAECGKQAWFAMSQPPPIQQNMIDLYLDRDMSAACVDFGAILAERFAVEEIHLTHDGHGRQQDYRDYFGCDVRFSAPDGRLVFDTELLDKPLPQSDPESSQHFQHQCQRLIAKLTSESHFVDDVRMLILGRPGEFPDIDRVASELAMSTRTLRRRLKVEGRGYRELVDEIRYGLAREYLGRTHLSMEEIAQLLGYTETGNFSHAFRRWSGQSPSSWRQAAATL